MANGMYTSDSLKEHIDFNRHILEEKYGNPVSSLEAMKDLFLDEYKLSALVLSGYKFPKTILKCHGCGRLGIKLSNNGERQKWEYLTDKDDPCNNHNGCFKNDEILLNLYVRTLDDTTEFIEKIDITGGECPLCQAYRSEEMAKKNPFRWMKSFLRSFYPEHYDLLPEEMRANYNE